jgi:hypothetical protein
MVTAVRTSNRWSFSVCSKFPSCLYFPTLGCHFDLGSFFFSDLYIVPSNDCSSCIGVDTVCLICLDDLIDAHLRFIRSWLMFIGSRMFLRHCTPLCTCLWASATSHLIQQYITAVTTLCKTNYMQYSWIYEHLRRPST